MIRRSTVAVAAALLVTALAAGCGNDLSLVGGDCASGLTQCDLRCVDLASDPVNCGACGHACSAGVTCVAGQCSDTPFQLDATVDGPSADGGDGATDGSSDAPGSDARDAGNLPDGATDGGASDGSTDAVAPDGSACAPPYDTLAQCGDCTTSCVAPDDACLPSDGGFACGQLCTAPRSNCGGTCVDKSDDPFNCGACGKVCPSHLCVAGACQGSTPGDVVLIGHDFATTPPSTAQGTILQNSVFISTAEPLRILSYERYADAAALAGAKAALAVRATTLHRTLAYTVSTTDADIPSKLGAAFDVLIVYDQKSAPAGALQTLGGGWASTLASFTKAGGVVVVLDGDTGTREMPQFSTSAGLFQVGSHAPIPAGSAVTVTGSSDVVGVGVLSPYGVWDHSASFTLGSLSNVTLVVRAGDGTGDPVVAHRTVP